MFSDPESALLGVKTYESFQAVISLLQKEKKPIDLIILSGDVSQDGADITYQRVADMLQSFNVPIYCIPGNHDSANTMAKVYPYGLIKGDRHIVLKPWQIILLNTQIPNAVEGYLEKSELNYLEKCLKTNVKEKAIIFIHHQPMPVGSKWLDNLGIKNADDFWEILKKYPQVHTVFFGHVHQEFEQKLHNIPCFSVPSTCIQFKPKQTNFKLDDLPPGYRWIELYEDGHLETGIKRVDKYVGSYEADAKGY